MDAVMALAVSLWVKELVVAAGAAEAASIGGGVAEAAVLPAGLLVE